MRVNASDGASSHVAHVVHTCRSSGIVGTMQRRMGIQVWCRSEEAPESGGDFLLEPDRRGSGRRLRYDTVIISRQVIVQ